MGDTTQEPPPGPGYWYGIRTRSLDSLSLNNVEIRHARGAIALEGDAAASLPDFNDFDGVTFADNVSEVSFDRDVLVGPAETDTIPDGWELGFTADTSSVDVGTHPNLVEIVVQGVLAVVSWGQNGTISRLAQ